MIHPAMRYTSVLAAGCLAFMVPSIAFAHAGSEWTVEINERGFLPSSLTILQGDTVTFVNTGTTKHWPASDLHPTHGIYSAFDPLQGIPPNERWSFRFTKTGTWGMHDHIFPQFTGSLTVEPDPDFVEEPTETVREPTLEERLQLNFAQALLFLFPSQRERVLTTLDVNALSQDDAAMLQWTELIGPTPLLADLLKDSGDGAAYDCHTAAHKLGRASYQLLGADAFTEGDSSCHSGYYHGAMEVLLQERGMQDLQKTAEEICKNFPTAFGHFECLHGIGHGILATVNYKLPDGIELCKSLSTSFEQSSCLGGMFMENIVTGLGIGATRDHTTAWLSDVDPLFPCNAIDQGDETLQRECYQMQTSWMYKLYPNDDVRVAKACGDASALGSYYCYVSFGRDAAGSTLRDPQKILEKCALLEEQHREACVMGALGVIVDFWGHGLKHQASEFCSMVEARLKPSCYTRLTQRLPELFSDAASRLAICAEFEAEYRGTCEQANR